MVDLGIEIEIRKVESHPERPRKRFPSGIDQDQCLTFRNGRADHWAGEGAKIQCLGEFLGENHNSWTDATTMIIQKRLLCVNELRTRQKKPKGSLEIIMPNPTNARIAQAGHEIIKTGKCYRCLTCSQTWTHSKRANLLRSGTCPGPEIWGCDEGKLCRPH